MASHGHLLLNSLAALVVMRNFFLKLWTYRQSTWLYRLFLAKTYFCYFFWVMFVWFVVLTSAGQCTVNRCLVEKKYFLFYSTKQTLQSKQQTILYQELEWNYEGRKRHAHLVMHCWIDIITTCTQWTTNEAYNYFSKEMHISLKQPYVISD